MERTTRAITKQSQSSVQKLVEVESAGRESQDGSVAIPWRDLIDSINHLWKRKNVFCFACAGGVLAPRSSLRDDRQGDEEG